MAGINLRGETSGSVEITSPAVAGDNTITLPNDNGSANQFFKNSTTAGIVTHSIMVELTNGNIGIGITNPDGLLTIKGNSDEVSTPSIRLLDGTDSREVSITNSSGDFVASTHGTDDTIHGRIKIFENGIIDLDTGGASGSVTNRLRITTAGVTSVTGSLSVNDNFYPTAGPLSNRNLVINGAMNVAQRSSNFVAASNSSNEGYQTLDRFGVVFASGAGGACSIGQSVTVPSDQGFSNSYKLDVTTADSSISASHYIAVYQYLEAQDVRNSGWNYTSSSSYMTLSFWVRSSKAGTYCCHFRQEDVSDRYYVFEYTLAADTWTKVTHSVPGDSSAVFNNDNGAGLRIGWMLQAGSSRDNATANQWATSSGNAATSNQVNFFDSTDNDFYLTGVQFEVGERATPFEHRSYGDELLRCNRYYAKVGGSRVTGGGGSSTVVTLVVSTPAEMRTTPDVEDVTINSMVRYDATGAGSLGSATGAVGTSFGSMYSVNISNLSSVSDNRVYFSNCSFNLDAEL